MQKLGLIGGTGPESTPVYYKEITAKVFERTHALPSLTVESLSVYDVLSYCDAGDLAGLSDYLATRLDVIQIHIDTLSRMASQNPL